jgi:hypothetical protein
MFILRIYVRLCLYAFAQLQKIQKFTVWSAMNTTYYYNTTVFLYNTIVFHITYAANYLGNNYFFSKI